MRSWQRDQQPEYTLIPLPTCPTKWDHLTVVLVPVRVSYRCIKQEYLRPMGNIVFCKATAAFALHDLDEPIQSVIASSAPFKPWEIPFAVVSAVDKFPWALARSSQEELDERRRTAVVPIEGGKCGRHWNAEQSPYSIGHHLRQKLARRPRVGKLQQVSMCRDQEVIGGGVRANHDLLLATPDRVNRVFLVTLPGGRINSDVCDRHFRRSAAIGQVARMASPFYFQIGLPLPGSPSSGHIALTLSITAWSMRMQRPHSRFVSGGSLVVASRPILEPRPDSGLAKSR